MPAAANNKVMSLEHRKWCYLSCRALLNLVVASQDFTAGLFVFWLVASPKSDCISTIRGTYAQLNWNSFWIQACILFVAKLCLKCAHCDYLCSQAKLHMTSEINVAVIMQLVRRRLLVQQAWWTEISALKTNYRQMLRDTRLPAHFFLSLVFREHEHFPHIVSCWHRAGDG